MRGGPAWRWGGGAGSVGMIIVLVVSFLGGGEIDLERAPVARWRDRRGSAAGSGTRINSGPGRRGAEQDCRFSAT